nr:MAG TPA: terminase large subunit [Caudoviricetes sp.]
MEKLSGLTLHNGDKVYTQEYVQFLRDADRKSPDKLKIIAQKGAQERILSVDADIKIVGGSRGGPLERNTIVLTKDGKKAIKDVECGDIVFGVNRKKVKVLSRSDYSQLNCFVITLENGKQITCSDDHVWFVILENKYSKIVGNTHAFITKEIAHYLSNGYKVYLPVCDAKEFIEVISCERTIKHDCCCIAVDGEDSVFLLDDFIVTHNSKSFSALMETLKDIRNSDFHGLILRKEKNDLDSLISDSYKVYSQFGIYNKSQNDMTWNFQNGGWLKFSYYAGAYQDFKDRFQGRQYSYIAIDEGTQVEYKKFKYLLTNNRNAAHIRNRFWITCNPDPESWVRKFIDWWVDEEGYIIPERDCQIRYCFMDGDTPDSIFWGNTREEVYEQCSELIDSLWKDSYEELGYTKLDMFIKSVTFIRADVSENIKLISTDASYIANLAQQDEEQRMRDLEANWNWKAAGDDMVKIEDLEGIFNNTIQLGDEVHRASADIAFTGGDNFVMWHWIGRHTKDLIVMRLDSKTIVSVVQSKLREWGVEECNFTYDMQGIGQYFKGFFPNAVPFNNQAAPIALDRKEEEGIRYLYKDLKSQCAFMFYTEIKERGISIEPALLDRKFSGNGFKNVPLRQILMKERKSLRRDETGSDKGFKLLPKKLAKRYVGHSPDFWESWFYIEIFRLTKKKHKKVKGLWMI